jgi:hypothetical protein
LRERRRVGNKVRVGEGERESGSEREEGRYGRGMKEK